MPFPDFDWRAERGSPVEARHINELQDASQHLLSRILLDTSGAGGCTYAVSLYILFVMDYVQNETGETERDQELWRHRIAQEDRIRCESGWAHSRFPGHALTPTGVMAIRCKQFHLPDL